MTSVALAATAVTVACQPAPTTCEGRTATIIGTAGADTITGTAGNDVIVGLAGNDTVYANGGEDVVCGGAGLDSLGGGAGRDLVDGGPDKDTIHGGPDVDTVSYRQHGARVYVDLISRQGGDGDVLTDVEDVVGTRYDDRLVGDFFDNRLVGLDGSDELFGYPGNDTLVDGGTSTAGVNWMMGGPGNDTLTGGPARDIASFGGFASEPVRVFLDSGVASGQGDDTLSGIETVNGSEGADVLQGDDRANTLAGMGGDDTLVGQGGDDVLEGGLGFDVASWWTSTTPVDVDLSAGRATGNGTDQLPYGIEAIEGGNADDRLVGDTRPNVIVGRAGYDTCMGGGGLDTMFSCP